MTHIHVVSKEAGIGNRVMVNSLIWEKQSQITVTLDVDNAVVPKIDVWKLSIAFRDKSLCARSGTCVGICPEDALNLDDDYYPVLDPLRCTQCGLCGEACPGGDVQYESLSEITFGANAYSMGFDGWVQKTYVGYCTDDTIRQSGAGGGVVTGLLADMLEHNDVDGCIVTRMRTDKPWLGEPFIARNREELLTSQSSHYSIIPLNSIFRQIRQTPGRYALAALPCHVHGYRKALVDNPWLEERIAVVVGLFCGGALETNVVPELLQTKGIAKESIKQFEFRGGEWPGRMRAIMADGTERNLHPSNYKDGAYNYFTSLYMPRRCQVCLDGSCEFADVAVSDTWTRDERGDYKFKASSRLLIRTTKGAEVVAKAVQRGTLVASDVSNDTSYVTHQLQTRRKGLNAPLRIERWRNKGINVPVYDKPTPNANRMERLTEVVVSTVLWLGRFKALRYPLVKFLTSSAGVPLIKLRILRKSWKYRK